MSQRGNASGKQERQVWQQMLKQKPHTYYQFHTYKYINVHLYSTVKLLYLSGVI